MIESHGKLLMTAFVLIILGVVFLGAIADDVNEITTSSYTVANETLNFVDATTAISNESHANNGNASVGATFTLTYNNLTVLTEVRNQSATVITGDCNVTLSSAYFSCNATNTTNFFVDYTYVSGKTESTYYDALTTLSALRNVTSEDIIGYCNVTLSTGALVCNNTYSTVGYADYTYETDVAYVRSSTTRSILTITVLFFAVAIVVLGIGYAIKSFKEGNLM